MAAAPRPGDGLRAALFLVLVPLVALVTLPFLLTEIGPAYSARFGGGTEGVFTAREQDCDEGAGCRWRGEFRSADGQVRRSDVAIIGGGVSAPGEQVDAVDSGSAGAVYPAGGGRNWLVITGVLAAVVAALGLWARSVRGRLRARQRRSTDSSARA